MDCTCYGIKLLYVDVDRCRLQCQTCGHVSAWLTRDEGTALVTLAGKVMRAIPAALTSPAIVDEAA